MDAVILGIGNAQALFAPEHSPLEAGGDDLLRIIDPQETCVSAFDLSVLRGDGIFEATTVWKGYPVSLENHLRRLAHSARLMDMPEPNQEAFSRAVDAIVRRYHAPEPGPMLRILVSRGLDPTTGVGEASGRGALPSVWMFLDGDGKLHELDPISLTSLSRGYPSDATSKAPWLLNGAKTLSYAVNQSMHRECDRRGADDAITYTTDGFTLECPNSSIVAQYGDRLTTPDPRIGILNGTSQREFFAWGRQEGMNVEYKKLSLNELRDADRLYMTHGGWVIPVKALDGRSYDVDPGQVAAINDAIHTGRTHDDALTIGPVGDYEL
ncbi:MAG: aminodeoxychorismate lyase [Bifidobacterium sp.]|jgi:4-amino-4-deoxychorismate lyase|nr:aminodeoxychorismate lyase [Bifidobacterium sp.]